jgi:asparagine N-glycosylation enzyme membrane subunit Stt3
MEGREPYHWKAAVYTGICFAGGLILMTSSGSSDSAELLILAGLALIGLSVAAFVITGGWQRADDLPIAKKIIAYLPVVLGGLAGFAVVAILWIARQAFKEWVEEL